MAVEETNVVRPRSTGEVLDDAWRLYRADAVTLLLLSSLFLAPAFAALLWLMGRPGNSEDLVDRTLWPLLTAFLLSLTGLGSGACQECLRRRVEGRPVTLGACLTASLRRCLGHVSIRAAGLVGILLGLGCLLMPGLTLWATLTPIHASLAYSRTGSLGEIQIGREARFDPSKAVAITLTRVPILGLALLNLILLVQMGLWTAGNLAGLDVALLAVQLAPTNPIFLVAGGLFCWLLLAPYFEATSFLLHLDTRVRQEGLDLLHRVQRVFAMPGRREGPALARTLAALLLGLVLFLPGHLASAQEGGGDRARLVATVQEVRKELAQVRKEVESADPYPGGKRWEGQLERLMRKLESAQPGKQRPFRWVHQELDTFADKRQAGAVEVLTDVEERLALVEDSLTLTPGEGEGARTQDVKKLLRSQDEAGKPAPQRREERKQKAEQDRQPQQHDEKDNDREPVLRRRVGEGMIPPLSQAPSTTFWLVLAGVGGGVLLALLWVWLKRRREGPARDRTKTGPTRSQAEETAQAPHEQAPASWFRQAEELSRAGQFKEAVRALYHAVLSMLHRQQLLRYERTRTNGEYLCEVRLSAQAPPGLSESFERLTRRFDRLWYGDWEGTVVEYSSCRELAEEIRQEVGTA
jgi:hypothetical protein